MRPILYRLAHRMIESCGTPSYINTDRFYLHLSVLRELKLYDDAQKLFNSEVGKIICANSLVVDEMRRQMWKEQGLYSQEEEHAKEQILEKK